MSEGVFAPPGGSNPPPEVTWSAQFRANLNGRNAGEPFGVVAEHTRCEQHDPRDQLGPGLSLAPQDPTFI